MRTPTALVLLFPLLFSLPIAQASLAVQVVKDVPYHEGEDADPDRHKLDLYLPQGQKDFLVLLFVHGGGWTKGDRTVFEKQGRLLASKGIGVASVGYRLTPQVQHPGHAQDIAAAFAWVHRNIRKYGGRADQLFLMGHSAGGHLIALLATDDRYLKAHGLAPTDIRGVIPVSGVYTIQPGRWSRVFGKDEEGCRAASPLAHVQGGRPPFLVLYADKDGAGFDKMAEDFCTALREAQCEAACLKVRDRTHGSILAGLANADDPATRAVLQFVTRHAGRKSVEDYTHIDPRELGVAAVPVRKDPKTGFVVGGKNPTALVRTLTEVAGRKITELERDMRPGQLSTAGFLGKDEKLLEVLAEDNRYVLEEQGLTHQELARHLHLLGAIAVKHALKEPKEFTYHDRRYRVKAQCFRGSVDSPFDDGTKTSCEAAVWNLDSGKKLTCSLLVPHLIERYGFYEGRGTRYRVEPRAILEVLDFLRKAKDR